MVYRLTESAEPPVGVQSTFSPDHTPHPVAPQDRSDEPSSTGATPRSRSGRMLWAQLLARIYEVLPLLCPACGGEMRIISFVTLPSRRPGGLSYDSVPSSGPRTAG